MAGASRATSARSIRLADQPTSWRRVREVLLRRLRIHPFEARSRPNGVFRAAGLALEEGALLYRQRFVENIAFNVAGDLQGYAIAAHGTHDAPTDDDILGNDPARNLGFLADDQGGAMNVALDLPIHQDFASREHVAGYGQVFSDDRWRDTWSPESWRFRCERWLVRGRHRSRASHWGQTGRHGARPTANGFTCGFCYRLLLIEIAKIAHIGLWLFTEHQRVSGARGEAYRFRAQPTLFQHR